MENNSKEKKKKTSQPRCIICNKFLDKEMPEYWAFKFIDFNNIESGKNSYVHHHCWNDIDFISRQKIVESAAIKGTLPMESMYANLKDIHNKILRENVLLNNKITEYKESLKNLEFIVRWHKYPDEKPNTRFEDTFWVTTSFGNDTERDVYIDGKWKYNNGNVIAWAYVLVPSPYNDLCYPSKMIYFRKAGDEDD